jgi:PPP family 3-phenylpropionic acid transporter
MPRRGSVHNVPSMSPSGVPIGIYYLALCGAMGLYLPYLSLYLSSQGMSEAAAVQVQAVVPFANLLVPPLLGYLADARHARLWLLRGFSAAATVTFGSLAFTGHSVLAVTVVLAAFAVARSPLLPLADATAHEHVRQHGGAYGRLRTWGSLGYLVTALLGGALYNLTSMRVLVWATAAMTAVSTVCAWRMPGPPPQRETHLLGDVGQLLRTRRLWLFLAAGATAQAAAVNYDTSLALHLARLGYAKNFLGVVVAIGVGAEMVLIAYSGRILTRFRSEHTLAAAYVFAALRWLLLSLVTSKIALLAQAPLHALSFGLYWVSATTLMREYAGPQASAAGQGLLSAAAAVGSIVGNVVGGDLLERGGGRLLFGAASGVAAVAAGLAMLHARAAGRPRRA